MKALTISKHGDLSQVGLAEVPRPTPGRGEVLVRTRAASLNHLDLFVVAGIPGIRLEMPHVLGSDGSGDVEALGDEVEGLEVGDRVLLNPAIWCGSCEYCRQGEQSLCVRLRLTGEHVRGTFAEYFVASADRLRRIPPNIDYLQAAAFPLVHQTAWRMIVTRGRLQAGQDILIHGVGGGVATAALGIARIAGARIFVTSSDDSKLTKARQLGADMTINYLKEDVVDRVLSSTRKRGVDLVVDSIGDKTWQQSLKLVRKGGTVVTCGATSGPNPQTEIRLIFWKQISILGSTMSNVTEFDQVISLLQQGRLQPVIDRVYPLSRGKEALERLFGGGQFGKVVLDMGTPEGGPE